MKKLSLILSLLLILSLVFALGACNKNDKEDPQGLRFHALRDGTWTVSEGESKKLSNNIVIPATYKGGAVVGIDPYAFNYTSITSITIPDSVTTIGDYAFENCDSLTSIIIPDSVTRIGFGAFAKCNSLVSVTIGDAVTSITSAFGWCESLTSVTLGASVTHIGGNAFVMCTSLTSITIPASVTTIDERAFGSCISLTNINFEGTVEQWNAIDKVTNWNSEVPATEVVCSDGVVSLTQD